MSYKNHSCDVCKQKPDCTIWGAVEQAGLKACYLFIPYTDDKIDSCGNCASESICDEAFSRGKTTYCSAFYIPLEKKCCNNCGLDPFCKLFADGEVNKSKYHCYRWMRYSDRTCLNCGSLFKEECPEDCDRNFDENCPKWTPDDKRFKMTEGSEYEPRKVIEDWGLNFYRGIEDGINHAEKRGDNKMNTDKYNVNLETKTFDSVKNPPYYTEGRQYEPRKVIEDWGLNFYLGNVVKYISRAGRKDVKTQYEDLLKAYQYLEWELDRLRLLDDKEGPSK